MLFIHFLYPRINIRVILRFHELTVLKACKFVKVPCVAFLLTKAAGIEGESGIVVILKVSATGASGKGTVRKRKITLAVIYGKWTVLTVPYDGIAYIKISAVLIAADAVNAASIKVKGL